MILASIGNIAISCVLTCTTLPMGVDIIEPERRVPPDPTPVTEPVPVSEREDTWDALARCETPPNGEWDYGPHSGWGSGIYHGGLQFHPDTWEAYRPPEYPQYAYQATREQQIVVAERVLDAQGWIAWPACSLKLGLR